MNPEEFGERDCRISVPSDVLQRLRQVVTQQVGPRDQYLRWCTPEFQAHADIAYDEIGRPPVTLHTVWNVFALMIRALQ
jgi:hypothetical protein